MTELLDRLKAALADRYTIERELGSGGMATVYLAEDLKHHRQVAVKVLRPDLAAALGAERFLREIEIAAKLTHPHILPLHDSGETAGFLFYVMPYVEGESLRDRLNREKQLPIDDALKIASEVADALGSAHRHNVVHRDIKPENILLEEGHAVVADFGVARAVTAAGEARLTETGIAIGTPAYLSPEQASGERELDGRSDIYSLGCVLYEMLAGEPPYTGPTPQAVIAKRLSEPVPHVSTLRETVPTTVEQVITRALAKARADRFSTAQQFANALSTPVPAGGAGVKRWQPVLVILAAYLLVGWAVLQVADELVQQFVLPGWVYSGAFVLLVIGLPTVLLTAFLQRGIRTKPELSASGVMRLFTWRNALTGGVFAFAVLGLGTAGYLLMRTLGIGPPATLIARGILEERQQVLLTDFQAAPEDTQLAAAMTEAFRVDLAQSLVLTLVEPSRIAQALTRMGRDEGNPVTEEVAREIAVREGIKAIISGRVSRVGRSLVLSASLLVAESGLPLTSWRETATDSSDILPAIDKVSKRLRERIGESLRSLRGNPPLREVTTSSLDALRKYTQAQQELELDKQHALLEEAIALDSGFAMAWRSLGVNLMVRGLDPEMADDALARAYELRDRLTDRERYHAVSIYYAVGPGFPDVEKAFDAWETLLELYPDDPRALNNLANMYEARREYTRAAELYSRALSVRDAIDTYRGLIGVTVALGQFDSARVALEQLAESSPSHNRIPQFMIYLESSQGRYATAEEEARLARERGGTAWASLRLSELALLHGRLVEAERHQLDALQVYQERDSAAAYIVAATKWATQVDIGVFHAPDRGANRVRAALERYALEAIELASRPYFWLATFYANAGMSERARMILAEYEAQSDENQRGLIEQRMEVPTWYQWGSRYREAESAIALAEGRLEDAVAKLRLADQGYYRFCRLCALPLIGFAFDQAAETDSAIAAFERFVTTPYLYRLELDWPYLPRICERLGQLYDEKGNLAKAAEYYAKFVDLWADADEALQLRVRAVRRRLGEIVVEQG